MHLLDTEEGFDIHCLVGYSSFILVFCTTTDKVEDLIFTSLCSLKHVDHKFSTWNNKNELKETEREKEKEKDPKKNPYYFF